MALINTHYNLFNATNLPGRLLTDDSFKSIDQNDNLKPQVYGSKSLNQTFGLSFRNQKELKKQYQQKELLTKTTYYDNYLQSKSVLKKQQKQQIIKNKVRSLCQFIIQSFDGALNLRENYLDDCENKKLNLSQQQIQRINSDMLSIQDQLKSKFQRTIKNINDQFKDFRTSLQFLLDQEQKWKGKSKTLFTPTFDKNILDWTINPITINLFNHQEIKNHERIVFLNFGKQTYLNIRVISQKTRHMYISFFNQYNVSEEFLRSQNEKDENIDNNISYNPTYAHLIQQQVKKVTVNTKLQNLHNIMLFPLNLFVSKDFDQGLSQPYQQFGTSSDINYLFNNLCVNRLKKYKPSKVIIYIDKNANLDPIHFADIIKTLSDISNNNIMFCIQQSIYIKSQYSKQGNFFSKYMNNQLQQNDIMRMRDYVTAFINVTSKQYCPISNKIISPSELFRNDIRYNYIAKHLKIFKFMEKHVKKIYPQSYQIQLHKKSINQATQQIKKNKDKIPYYQLITNLNTSSKINLIHYHDKYQISKQGVIYEILKRKQIKQRKYLLKLAKQNSQKEILQSLKHINFYYKEKGQKNYTLIFLEEYSQVQIIERNKKLLVTVFNYLNSKGQHEILRGITDINSSSVFLFQVVLVKPVKGELKQQKKQKSDNVVYCGYGINNILNQVDVYYTWPLKIDIIQNFKAIITGKIYRPSVSDQILRLKTQFKKGSQKQFYYYTLFVQKNNRSLPLLYGSKFVEIPNSTQKFQLYACGGYCLQNRQSNSFLYIKQDIGGNYQMKQAGKNFYIPPLLGFNVITKLSQKDKLPIYTFYGGKSPYFFNFKYGVIKLNLQNNGKITFEQNYQLNNSIQTRRVNQSGMFNILETYPENKITKKYFDQSERLRYTIKLNLGTLIFDEVEIQSMEQMLNYPLLKFNPEMPDSGVAVEMQDKKILYVEFIFHNPFTTNQPYFMTVNKSNIIGEQHQNRNIKLNRKGYLVEIRVKDKRLICKGQQSLMDFVGNLFPSLYVEADGLVKMYPNSIQVSSQIEKSLKHPI